MTSALRRAAVILPFGLLALWMAIYWFGPLINDVAWQLWIGSRLNAGAKLYSDILEINPPLWFWIGAAVEGAAPFLDLSPVQLLQLCFAAVALSALLLLLALPIRARERLIAGTMLGGVLVLTSPYAHLQREQYVWISVVPLVQLYAVRAERKAVGTMAALAIGMLAASGLALKHYFMLLPILLELWLWWRTREWRLRPELCALVVLGMGYIVAVLVLTPEYLSTILPLVQLAYGAYDEPGALLLSQPALVAALLGTCAVILAGRSRRASSEAVAVAAVAFALTFIWQSKNFPYQAIPALGAGMWAGLLQVRWQAGRQWRQNGGVAGAAAVAVSVSAPLFAGAARYDQTFASATRNLQPGDAVVALSSSSAMGWPAVWERQLMWPSRHMSIWMVPRGWIAELQGQKQGVAVEVARQARREVAAEIACSRPQIVVVDTRFDDRAPGGDSLMWYLSEPAMSAALKPYREIAPVHYLRRFRLASTIDRGSTCDPRELKAIQPATSRF